MEDWNSKSNFIQQNISRITLDMSNPNTCKAHMSFFIHPYGTLQKIVVWQKL